MINLGLKRIGAGLILLASAGAALVAFYLSLPENSGPQSGSNAVLV